MHYGSALARRVTLPLLFPLGLLTVVSTACGDPAAQVEEANKVTVERIVADGVNKGDFAVFREVVAPDYRRHSQSSPGMEEIEGIDRFIEFLQWNYVAFPDWHEEIDLILADGDYVAYVTTGTGTHTGPMGDVPATGKRIEVRNFIVHRFENGQIAETWVGWDNLAVLQQLGLFPPQPAGDE